MSRRTYWKESTITRHKIYWDIRSRDLTLKHFVDDQLFEDFISWIDEVYPQESTAWLRTDWADAYLEFDKVVDSWKETRLVNAATKAFATKGVAGLQDFIVWTHPELATSNCSTCQEETYQTETGRCLVCAVRIVAA